MDLKISLRIRRIQARIFPCLMLVGALITSVPVSADQVLVAVASNFTLPMRAIAERFEAETGHDLELAFGSSGRFVAQIRNGAPFQVFLSADQDRVSALIESGHAQQSTRFTYATGTLVLWTLNSEIDVSQAQALQAGDFNRLALANPDLAPYGRAAVEVLENLNLVDATHSRWVQGENIAQAYQFVATGNADVGFVAASQVTDGGEILRGNGWPVPQRLHEPINQDAVLLSTANDCQACSELLEFLRSETSRDIIRNAGYRVD